MCYSSKAINSTKQKCNNICRGGKQKSTTLRADVNRKMNKTCCLRKNPNLINDPKCNTEKGNENLASFSITSINIEDEQAVRSHVPQNSDISKKYTQSAKGDDMYNNIKCTCKMSYPDIIMKQGATCSKQCTHPTLEQFTRKCNIKNSSVLGELSQETASSIVKNGFQVCVDCSKTHQTNLQKLFKICEYYPDFIINSYQAKGIDINENTTQNNEYSQIQSTQENDLSDAKYHYLMADGTTSMALLRPLSTVAIQKTSESTGNNKPVI